MWNITDRKQVKLKNPVLLEGLPGIANVGKVVCDYLAEQYKAEKIASYTSHHMPNTVFVNQENLVELPKIELYHAKAKGKDYLFLLGDVQPNSEKANYEFCNQVLEHVKELGCKQVITLGGIGMTESPSKPSVYCTGNDKNEIKQFVEKGAKDDIYGVVGPIIGVSGLLIGLSSSKDIKAVSLLVETYNHPMYLGLKEAKEILKVLEKTHKLPVDYEEIDKEIKLSEKEMAGEDVESSMRKKNISETNYIG